MAASGKGRHECRHDRQKSGCWTCSEGVLVSLALYSEEILAGRANGEEKTLFSPFMGFIPSWHFTNAADSRSPLSSFQMGVLARLGVATAKSIDLAQFQIRSCSTSPAFPDLRGLTTRPAQIRNRRKPRATSDAFRRVRGNAIGCANCPLQKRTNVLTILESLSCARRHLWDETSQRFPTPKEPDPVGEITVVCLSQLMRAR